MRPLYGESSELTALIGAALKGTALRGESRLDMAGLGGSMKLGNEVGPVGGADMGALVKGLGGTREAEAKARALSTAEAFSEAEGVVAEVGEEDLVLQAVEVAGDVEAEPLSLTLALLALLMLLSSAFSLASAAGEEELSVADSAATTTGETAGELLGMALVRKSA